MYSYGPIYMEGVWFLVELSATVYFGGPIVRLDKLLVSLYWLVR